MTADQLTLKLASGQTVQIPLDSSTTYHSQAPATAADVTTGSTVQVQVRPAAAAMARQRRPERARRGRGGRGVQPGRRVDVTVVPEVTRGPARPAPRRPSATPAAG